MWVGLAIRIVAEAATLARIEPFWSWNTPIAWTGFIIFADAIVWRARGDSWLRSAPREFAWLALASIALWVMFEGFNLVLRNWHYVGLPENTALRYFGYAWSFATIWPALFVGADLVGVARERRRGSRRPGGLVGSGSPGSAQPLNANLTNPPAPRGLRVLPFRPAILSIAAGAAMLLAPFAVPNSLAPSMAA